ncbi:UDP-N-acetylmuramoyl-tripeptide--D-alanyl-D-alanine ligase [Stanieria cyanosphaera PCC 7437]|uniref:UDP-N-acetylmuramoyl-tripeptide--D-alanyl-D-alanine ligase n=1 Tax=Stanieria cyanosphaera (strain ATCC 29371 / PCC 7437) TaxID=111780 RepID=K9XV99_STAC7|nr:UDP-N-acetylmuramoyl-tripeptide--D-alanyl-D-alanine ligase [Stanieria cyanosphaera]AFZ36006.1 UDP-N-acetylmuramoyl-tripeptide--D-alanyl-D-alanine ligase [Stanieria cyanosphaera PCC 7437]
MISLHELSKILDLDHIKLTESELNKSATGITTDTRNLKPGEIFVALSGENFDGHNFASVAVEKGAIALILSRALSLVTDTPQLIVSDTLVAYQQIANWWRNCFDIPVIGITGSVGKTTTKELIAAVLNTQGKVLKTEANYNNEIGVPKTLLELRSGHDYAVIEMAMRATGEIALLTNLTRPTIGVITNVGTAHIGRLGSKEAIARAKCELLAQMPLSSVAILNHDNPLLLQTAAKVWHGETLTYGLAGGDLKGELLEDNILKVEGREFPLPLAGIHNASNYLAAIAVAKVLELDLDLLSPGLTVELPKGRARRYEIQDNIVILDETYNAGFESMIASLQMLKDTPGTRHLAVLGTMKELGKYSAQLHHQVGEKVKELDLDRLFVLVDEPETEAIATAAQGISYECFDNHQDLISTLQAEITKGDRILVKASNSVGLSRIVEELLKCKT